jgi:hypothetical protein
MDKENAIKIISQICAGYKGTLEEHNIIQGALTVIREEFKNNGNNTKRK